MLQIWPVSRSFYTKQCLTCLCHRPLKIRPSMINLNRQIKVFVLHLLWIWNHISIIYMFYCTTSKKYVQNKNVPSIFKEKNLSFSTSNCRQYTWTSSISTFVTLLTLSQELLNTALFWTKTPSCTLKIGTNFFGGKIKNLFHFLLRWENLKSCTVNAKN
jgi:hypothetical protein